MKFFEFTTELSKFPNFPSFRQPSINFGTFPETYFLKKTHRLRIEISVAAGSVSERYQTSYCAQFPKRLIESVKFFSDLFCEIINFQKVDSLDVEQTFEGKMFL